MDDMRFKGLPHPIGDHKVVSAGKAVTTGYKGYKPDVLVADSTGLVRFILESENKTDRKAFLGDLLKAEMYAEQSVCTPELIIVMTPSSNTTVRHIAKQLHVYAAWLAEKKNGSLSLSAVQVISDTDYEDAIAKNELISSSSFRKRGLVAWPRSAPIR